MSIGLNSADADDGVNILDDGLFAECWAEEAWLGVRGRPGVLRGAYQFEVEIANECLLRVGWAAGGGRRSLGTDDRSFAYGGTAMKSTGGKFEPYGDPHEGVEGAVLTCLVDRRDIRRQTISFCLNGQCLGVAFHLPVWLADVPLFPGLCGREDWKASCRFSDFTFPQHGYRPLAEADPCDVVAEIVSHAVLAAAPRIRRRELQSFDVPLENIVELRSEGDELLDVVALLEQLEREHGDSDFHVEVAQSSHTALVSFSSHRTAHGVANVPPPHTVSATCTDFSDDAKELLRSHQPTRGATTPKVAKRFIIRALQDDHTITKDQLRRMRATDASSQAGKRRRPPPAPPMPDIEVQQPLAPAPPFASTDTPPPKRSAIGGQLFAGAVNSLRCGSGPTGGAPVARTGARKGPRNALG